MYDWFGDGLFLEEKSGADLHLPADPERIDPLVSCGRCCAWPYHLPVIVLCTPTDQTNRSPVGGNANQIEAAIVCEICCREYSTINRRRQATEALGIAQP